VVKVSTKARYALRAMIELALHEGEGPRHLQEIALAQRLSTKYLEQLTIALRHAGLLRAQRGPSGGYELARPADEITPLDIFLAVEGPLELLNCVGSPATCERSPTCVARRLWMEAGAAMNSVLARVTLADLRDDQRAANSVGPLCYDI
jgi:Rrf2 family protein